MPLSARAHTRTHTALLIVSSIDWTPAILLQILFCTHKKKIHCHRFSWFHGAPFCESFGPPGVLNETSFSFNRNTVNGICFYKKTHIDLLSIVLFFRLYQVGFCLT